MNFEESTNPQNQRMPRCHHLSRARKQHVNEYSLPAEVKHIHPFIILFPPSPVYTCRSSFCKSRPQDWSLHSETVLDWFLSTIMFKIPVHSRVEQPRTSECLCLPFKDKTQNVGAERFEGISGSASDWFSSVSLMVLLWVPCYFGYTASWTNC